MIHRICESLHLPEASQFIRIEDVSCPSEIAKARAIRIKEGKHIIPVPTMELKPHFQGYLLDPIRSFFYGRNGKKISPFERSVVRPVFSYYGKLTFSNDVLEALVRMPWPRTTASPRSTACGWPSITTRRAMAWPSSCP